MCHMCLIAGLGPVIRDNSVRADGFAGWLHRIPSPVLRSAMAILVLLIRPNLCELTESPGGEVPTPIGRDSLNAVRIC